MKMLHLQFLLFSLRSSNVIKKFLSVRPATQVNKLISTAIRDLVGFFCHDPNLLAIGEGRNAGRTVNQELFLWSQLHFHHSVSILNAPCPSLVDTRPWDTWISPLEARTLHLFPYVSKRVYTLCAVLSDYQMHFF